MDDDIETRVLQLFEVRLERSVDISEGVRRALLEDQRESDFGDDQSIVDRALGELEGDR